MVERTILYGQERVPVLERFWPVTPPEPYRKTYVLKPGDRWSDAPTTPDQRETYVVLNGETMPVGAAIARELISEGASWACFTELWNTTVLVGPDLVCLPHDGPEGALIDHLGAEHGSTNGLPDALAQFPDGRVAMREAKRHNKDSINANQHAFAITARRVLGDLLDLAVVEWACE